MLGSQARKRLGDAVRVERPAEQLLLAVAVEVGVLDAPVDPVLAAYMAKRKVGRHAVEPVGRDFAQLRAGRRPSALSPGLADRKSGLQPFLADPLDKSEQLACVGDAPDRRGKRGRLGDLRCFRSRSPGLRLWRGPRCWLRKLRLCCKRKRRCSAEQCECIESVLVFHSNLALRTRFRSPFCPAGRYTGERPLPVKESHSCDLSCG
jgi:hypothetical protein